MESMRMILSELRPGQDLVREYRAAGAWRNEGPLADLRKWRDETPDAHAVIAYRAGTGVRRLTYREFSDYVERFAGHCVSWKSGRGRWSRCSCPTGGR